LRGRTTGLHRARALAVGGASARNMKPPAKEDDYVKQWKGWLFLRRRSGRPNGRRSARCFLRAVREILGCVKVEFNGHRPRTHTTRHDTDSEDDVGRSGGGRRRHDSSNDGSSKGELDGGGGETEARPVAPRLVPGGCRRRREAVEGSRWQERAPRLLGGGGRSRYPAVGLGGEPEEGTTPPRRFGLGGRRAPPREAP